MIKFIWFILLTASLPVASFGDSSATNSNSVVTGNSAFALDLYGRLRTQPGNLFFSPYSISTALAMTYAGARGITESQMARTMHFDLSQEKLPAAFAALLAGLDSIEKEGQVQLEMANSIWPQQNYKFLPAYLQLLKEDYETVVTPLDYTHSPAAASGIINDWVETKTHHKITNLIAPGALSPATRLVLVNAIYFKGNWVNQFDPKATAQRAFNVTSDKTVECQMMTHSGLYAYTETPGLQILELPYKGDDLSMIVFLPKDRDGLGALEDHLTTTNLAAWMKTLNDPGTLEKVSLFLPKFKLTCEFSLASTLTTLGMTDAFGPGADFSGMDGSHDLFINAIIHKAFVDVQETGTEAAAATAVGMSMNAVPRHPPPLFLADHPFLFLIRDKHDGSILFIGRVISPPAG